MSNIRIAPPWQRPAPDLVAAFAEESVANLGDATGRLNIVDAGITPLWPGARILGTALPVMTVAGDNLAVNEALDLIQPGDVIVVNAAGYSGRAIMGDNLAQRFDVFGATGAIIDGCARDADIIASLRFPVFSRGRTPAGPWKNGPGTIGEPIALGGVVVQPGDIVVGDADGIIVIPPARADEALRAVAEVRALEISKDAEAAQLRADNSGARS